MQNEKKRAATRAKLQDGFLELYSRKSYSDITVDRICREAGVYRATFYNYYDRKDDLLREIEDMVTEQLVLASDPFMEFRLDVIVRNPETIMEVYRGLISCYHENEKAIVTLLSPHANNSFFAKFKDAVNRQYTRVLELNGRKLGEKDGIMIDSFASGLVNAIYLFLSEKKLSDSEMTELLVKGNNSFLKLMME